MTTLANTIEPLPQRTAALAAPTRILIVADDLTGACDSGVAFVASGHSVRVLLNTSQLYASQLDPRSLALDRNSNRDSSHTEDRNAVLALTTESRDLTASEAAASVTQHIAKFAPHTPGALVFKKIDSAARGHFAAEIDAALRASGATLALVAPAFPAAGRTVTNGILTVRDWSGQDTAIALHNLFPPEESARIANLPTGSEDELHRGLSRALEDSTRILLCDATTQSDLDRLAAAALRISQPLLWAGSAGLARALAAQMQTPAVQFPAAVGNVVTSHPAQSARRTGRTLFFTGTPHPITALQVAHLEQTPRDHHPRAIHRVPESNASPANVISAFTAEAPAALILTGGDTAAFVLRALGANSILLAGELAPGIPWGIVEGGLAHGCTVVTKSGGFGERDALLRCFEFCESEDAR